MNAMVFAARHPDLFISAGSFSGFVDPFDPAGIQVVEQFAELDNELCGASDDPFGVWGDPDLHPMGWEGHDPRNLASNLEGISVYISSGNGIPCPGDPDDPVLEFAEATVFAMSQHLDAALTAAHTLEEDTPAAQVAAAADPHYFVTRAVRFEPVEPEGH